MNTEKTSFTASWSLCAADRRDLEWYFSNPAVAGVRSGSLASGLERLWLFASYKPCMACGGRYYPWRKGTGFAPQNGVKYRVALRAYRLKMARLCKYQVATGEKAERLQLLGFEVVSYRRLAELWPEVEPLECVPCTECDMLGVVPSGKRSSRESVTVRPTGGSLRGAKSTDVSLLDEAGVIRWGKVRAGLIRANRVWDMSEIVLREYHGPGGSYRDLWHLTQPGMELLSRRSDDDEKSQHEFFDDLADHQQMQEAPTLRLMELAQQEAIELHKRAGRSWNKANPRPEQAAE